MQDPKRPGPEDREGRQPERLTWQVATVESITVETYRVKTFRLRLPSWKTFRSGMHYDVRLTAPDGYQAQRSYSIATSPETRDLIDLTVEKIEDGEVSPYFHDELIVDDRIELRGPIGGAFTWTASMGGPLLLIAGGSGIVPLMSMLRHRESAARHVQTMLLYSSRSPDDVIYSGELDALAEAGNGLQVAHTFTRTAPERWDGFARRVDARMISDVFDRLGAVGRAYVCGPGGFVETVASALVDAGITPERIHTERFGPADR
ncbi:MAG: ferredoxin reductase [Dehalococcoidia bacterium]|jgi:ferredoxin-NADP reductase|nr:ferredoxin reductase [Dehalococcoidia bacterium]